MQDRRTGGAVVAVCCVLQSAGLPLLSCCCHESDTTHFPARHPALSSSVLVLCCIGETAARNSESFDLTAITLLFMHEIVR